MKFASFALVSLFARTTLALVGTWDVLDVKLPESVSDLTANLGPDGLIYIAGGCNASEGNVYNNATGFFDCLSITDSFVSFNPITNEVVSLASLPRPRYRHGAAVSNNRLWLIGGRTVATDVIMEIDVYDFDTQTWTTPGNHTEDTSDNGAFGDENYVYVVGGWNTDYIARADVWRIDSTSVDTIGAIERVASLKEARGDIKVDTNNMGAAFVVGGFTDQNNYCPALATAEKYTVASDSWSSLDDLSSPRGDMSVVELEGRLLAIGGETQVDLTCAITDPDPGEGTVVMDDVETLDDSGTWITVASIPNSRFRFDSASVGNKIYTFGGQNSYNKNCTCYPITNEILVFTEQSSGGSGTAPTPAPSAAYHSYSAWVAMVSYVVLVMMVGFV